MSTTVQAVPQDTSTAATREFFVPNILAFNLKKTAEERLQVAEADNPSSRQNGDSITEEHEDPSMTPKRQEGGQSQQTSSFLLEPFLKPVGHKVESAKENPVLKALFGGRAPVGLTPWNYLAKTSISNCHPFKKTELSHDLDTETTPVQVPKSLLERPLKSRTINRKSPVKRKCSSVFKANILKEVVPNSQPSVAAPSMLSIYDRKYNKPRAATAASPSGEKVSAELSQTYDRKKKLFSQSNIVLPKARVQYVNSERLIQLRTIVDNAIKNHKIYSMNGCYTSVRNALKQRGWIEKIDSDVKGRRKFNKYDEIGLYDAAFQFVQKYQTVVAMKLSMQTNSGFAHSDEIRYTGQGEAEIINRMLRNVTEDLCWLSRTYPYYCWKDFDKFEMVNRLPRAYFSNKVGLCTSLQQIQWFYEAGVCSTQFPRTYNMSVKEEVEAFKEDFRLTACINVLKWFLQSFKSGGEKAVQSTDGKVDMNIMEFALRRCAEFIKSKQHEDIDVLDSITVWDNQWDHFISQYYKLINDGHILKETKDTIGLKPLVTNVQSMINILKQYWPQYDIDGYQNFWIVKPGGRCCGAGIVIKNNLDQILVMVNSSTLRESRFVVQKYIEKPLLIYNTKFDIRQWFLVTSVYPLTIWMYKESYLRFCSQPFTLKNTHESIHLCNNAVQRKYKNAKRDRGLPDENMWDCYTFQTYLKLVLFRKAIGHPDVWEKHIYPGMREGFVGALLASQESMDRKKNCFELYGADFMISDTLTDGPWLIEINSNPAMDSSTSVTARMCPQVLEDIIKVVIDRRDNKSAPTGGFEMVYRQNCPPIPPYLGMSLCIKGKKAYKPSGDFKTLNRKISNTSSSIPATPDVSSASEENPEFGSSGTKEAKNGPKRVDWIKKNIEDLKVFQCEKQPKADAQAAQENHSPLSTEEMKEIINQISQLKNEEDEDKDKDKDKDDLDSETEINDQVLAMHPRSSLKDMIQSIWMSFVNMLFRTGKPEINLLNLLKELSRKYKKKSSRTTASCPNFELTEIEGDATDEKELVKTKSEESFESYFSTDSSLPCPKGSWSCQMCNDLQNHFRSIADQDQNASSKSNLKANKKLKSSASSLRKHTHGSSQKFQTAQKKPSSARSSVGQQKVKNYASVSKVSLGTKKKSSVAMITSKAKMMNHASTSKLFDVRKRCPSLTSPSGSGGIRNSNHSLSKIKGRAVPLLPKKLNSRKSVTSTKQNWWH